MTRTKLWNSLLSVFENGSIHAPRKTALQGFRCGRPERERVRPSACSRSSGARRSDHRSCILSPEASLPVAICENASRLNQLALKTASSRPPSLFTRARSAALPSSRIIAYSSDTSGRSAPPLPRACAFPSTSRNLCYLSCTLTESLDALTIITVWHPIDLGDHHGRRGAQATVTC